MRGFNKASEPNGFSSDFLSSLLGPRETKSFTGRANRVVNGQNSFEVLGIYFI